MSRHSQVDENQDSGAEVPAHRYFCCEQALVFGEAGPELWDGACFEVNDAGRIVSIHRGSAAPAHADGAIVHDLGHRLVLPGLVNAHSHAFQRLIRGATGARAAGDPSSFWSWREAMYGAVAGLDPDSFEVATRRCFSEMLASGITSVGEFHYVHHQANGAPYEDANELSLRVIEAARAVGIRLSLLEVFYERCAYGKPALPEQARFCDASVDAYIGRLDALRGRAAADLQIGITPHSVRAVTSTSLARLAEYARSHDLVMHAHVSEQPAENASCREEHGKTPTQVFADAGCLERSGSFTAVHAIHVDATDLKLLADHNICACPTTEADLGDGIIPASDWLAGGSSLCLGSDSNSVIDLIQEARLLEMHERLRRQSRLCVLDDEGRVAPRLAAIACEGGARAIGRPEAGRLAPGRVFDVACVDLDQPLFADLPVERALDILFTAGTAACIDQVWIGGERRK